MDWVLDLWLRGPSHCSLVYNSLWIIHLYVILGFAALPGAQAHPFVINLGCWHVTHWLSHTTSGQENLPSVAWSGHKVLQSSVQSQVHKLSPLGLAVSVSLECWHVTQLHTKLTRELTFCCLVGLSLQSSEHVYPYLFFFFLFLALQHCQVQKHVPMPSAWDADMLPNHTISRFKSSLTFCCFIGLQSSVQSQEHKLSPFLSQCQPWMLTCHSVAQYLDKRTYLLLLGWAVTAKLCPKPGTQAFPLVVTLTVSALDANVSPTDSVTQ